MTIAQYRGKGKNPNSHKNLEGNRRVPNPQWGSVKRDHSIGLTDETWETLQQLSAQHNLSISNLTEATVRLLKDDPRFVARIVEFFHQTQSAADETSRDYF